MTDAERADLEDWLAKLETARRALITGASAQSVSYNGRSVTYRQTDLGTIEREIADVKRKLGRGTNRPLRIRF